MTKEGQEDEIYVHSWDSSAIGQLGGLQLQMGNDQSILIRGNFHWSVFFSTLIICAFQLTWTNKKKRKFTKLEKNCNLQLSKTENR